MRGEPRSHLGMRERFTGGVVQELHGEVRFHRDVNQEAVGRRAQRDDAVCKRGTARSRDGFQVIRKAHQAGLLGGRGRDLEGEPRRGERDLAILTEASFCVMQGCGEGRRRCERSRNHAQPSAKPGNACHGTGLVLGNRFTLRSLRRCVQRIGSTRRRGGGEASRLESLFLLGRRRSARRRRIRPATREQPPRGATEEQQQDGRERGAAHPPRLAST